MNIKDFVLNLYKQENTFPYITGNKIKPNNFIPYSGPFWDQEEMISMFECLISGKWMPSGAEVAKFENKFSKIFGFKSSLMVNSGSSANLLMIAAVKKILNWNDNDEIILSVVGFPTTLSAITLNNLKPVFCDIEYSSLNFDVDAIERLITDKTRAIFISPVLGNAPDFDKLLELKNKFNIELILDNCDSLGSKWKNKYLSEYCVASSCSFYMAHHISTGEGGMISSNNELIVEECRKMSWWGRDCYCIGKNNTLSCGTCGNRFSKWIEELDFDIDHRYYFTSIGYNLKPLDFQGAIGLKQLDKINEIETRRRRNKLTIQEIFQKNINNIEFVEELPGAHTSWFGVAIKCNDSNLKNKLVRHLEANNIQTRNYFAGNILLQPAYKHLGDWKLFPNANKVLSLVFFVGCAPFYDDKDIQYIESVTKMFNKNSLTVIG